MNNLGFVIFTINILLVNSKPNAAPGNGVLFEGASSIPLQSLLSHGVDIDVTDDEGKTLAYRAAEIGDVEMLKTLIHYGADLNITDNNDGMTPLHIAAKNGHANIVSILVEQKLDIDAQDDYNKTPLFRAVEEEEPACYMILLKKGANPYTRDNRGLTIMHEAAYNGEAATIKVLSKYRDLINAKDNDSKTPLYYAAYKNQVESTQDLVDLGGEVLQSVMWGAVGGGHVDITDYLLQKGGDPNSRDGTNNETILMKAVIANNKDMVQLLLDNGADVDAVNNQNMTALHWAASWDRIAAVKLLIQKGACETAMDNDGKTPLDVAGPQSKLYLKSLSRINKIHNDTAF